MLEDQNSISWPTRDARSVEQIEQVRRRCPDNCSPEEWEDAVHDSVVKLAAKCKLWAPCPRQGDAPVEFKLQVALLVKAAKGRVVEFRRRGGRSRLAAEESFSRSVGSNIGPWDKPEHSHVQDVLRNALAGLRKEDVQIVMGMVDETTAREDGELLNLSAQQVEDRRKEVRRKLRGIPAIRALAKDLFGSNRYLGALIAFFFGVSSRSRAAARPLVIGVPLVGVMIAIMGVGQLRSVRPVEPVANVVSAPHPTGSTPPHSLPVTHRPSASSPGRDQKHRFQDPAGHALVGSVDHDDAQRAVLVATAPDGVLEGRPHSANGGPPKESFSIVMDAREQAPEELLLATELYLSTNPDGPLVETAQVLHLEALFGMGRFGDVIVGADDLRNSGVASAMAVDGATIWMGRALSQQGNCDALRSLRRHASRAALAALRVWRVPCRHGVHVDDPI